MDTIQANIKNLTALWRTVGQQTSTYKAAEAFEYCMVEYAEWPNKLWFPHEVLEENIRTAKSILLAKPRNLVIPYWDIYSQQYDGLFQRYGFEQKSEQIGMSSKLTQDYRKRGDSLQLKKVSNKTDAALWSQLFFQAFNYSIHPKTIVSSYNQIQYLIAYIKDDPIGTAILFSTDNEVMGIHSMGIIPEKRRNGYAEQMMVKMLVTSKAQGFKYATLQASNMGKGLYLKLGFKEEFNLKNYHLRPTA